MPAVARHSAETREHARRLIFEEGCSIAEAARTVGVAKATPGRWFPDAPRLSRRERSEWANLCKYAHAAVGL